MNTEQNTDEHAAEALASVCSPGFVTVLQTLGLSIAVSSYRSGKLILLRADGDTLNTHYRDLARPTGIARRRDRLARTYPR